MVIGINRISFFVEIFVGNLNHFAQRMDLISSKKKNEKSEILLKFIVMKTTNENSFALIRFCVCFNKIPHSSDLAV